MKDNFKFIYLSNFDKQLVTMPQSNCIIERHQPMKPAETNTSRGNEAASRYHIKELKRKNRKYGKDVRPR